MNRRTTLPLPTARFSVVVAKCGRPSVHLALVAPDKDRELRNLDRQNRVMTLHQAHRGGGADHGLVGIHPGPDTQRLVFPKSLRRFAGRRIVGVNYELLEEIPQVTGKIGASVKKPGQRKSEIIPFTQEPAPLAPLPPEPPPAPPTMPEVLRELRILNRLLQGRKYEDARAHTRQLTKRVARGLD